jgi:protein ImuB
VVVCALIPHFELSSALGARRELLRRAVALAPEPGGAALVGEVSGPAEAHGVRAGMRLGEALARCAELVLVPADPVRAERAWEEVTLRLEGIGAEVFSEHAGEAFFEADGLRGLWGGDVDGVLARARRAIEVPVRLGAGPSRFCAFAAAVRSHPRGHRRPGRPVVVPRRRGRAFLAPLPVALLAARAGAELPERLEQLGIATLGALAALSDDAVADRFGEPGLLALRLARGGEEKMKPRSPSVPLAAEIELPEVLHGSHLQRAVELLIDRLLADPQRRGRTVRRLRLSARLAGGGGWRCERVLRRAGAAQRTLRLVLDGAIEELPGPAELLRLEATALGPPAGDQLTLTRSEEERRNRLAEAVRQVRAAAGRESVLRVLDVDPQSRLPERRAVLTPYVS